MGPHVPRERLLNKLRELGFVFKKEKGHVQLYRRSSDGTRATLRKRDLIDVAEVTAMLRQAGCSEEEIRSFIQQAQV